MTIKCDWRQGVRNAAVIAGVTYLSTFCAMAQYGGGGTGGGGTGGGGTVGGNASGGGAPTSVYNFHGNYHLSFDSPEAWGLKYFTSTSLLSGLPPVEIDAPPAQGHRGRCPTLGADHAGRPAAGAITDPTSIDDDDPLRS